MRAVFALIQIFYQIFVLSKKTKKSHFGRKKWGILVENLCQTMSKPPFSINGNACRLNVIF